MRDKERGGRKEWQGKGGVKSRGMSGRKRERVINIEKLSGGRGESDNGGRESKMSEREGGKT